MAVTETLPAAITKTAMDGEGFFSAYNLSKHWSTPDLTTVNSPPGRHGSSIACFAVSTYLAPYQLPVLLLQLSHRVWRPAPSI